MITYVLRAHLSQETILYFRDNFGYGCFVREFWQPLLNDTTPPVFGYWYADYLSAWIFVTPDPILADMFRIMCATNIEREITT